jgi:putative phosphoribosyl transferase
MLFEDRQHAGRALAALLAAQLTVQSASLPSLENAVVLALPRGGVPVGWEVARALNLPLDVLVVRKLGAPGQRELAIGAVASSGVIALNQEFINDFQISEDHLRAMEGHAMREIGVLERAYRGNALAIPIEGRTVILVDDGLATGATMKAAARAVRPRAKQVIVAVPVAAASTCRDFESEADRVLCVAIPALFGAVGQFYRDFRPTTDEEVRVLLADARTTRQSTPAA